MQPKVTIIIPVYNVEPYLRRYNLAPMGQDVYNPRRKPGESGHHTRLALQGRNNV